MVKIEEEDNESGMNFKHTGWDEKLAKNEVRPCFLEERNCQRREN
jgi:hypothetical protein